MLDGAGFASLFAGSNLGADHLIFPLWTGMLCPWQEELVPEFMLFQKILWRWSQRWSWPCLPAWWAEEWSEYKGDNPCKGKQNQNATKTQPATLSAWVADRLWPRWNAVGLGTVEVHFVLLCKTNLSKFSGGGVLTNRRALFPKESLTYQELTEMHS